MTQSLSIENLGELATTIISAINDIENFCDRKFRAAKNFLNLQKIIKYTLIIIFIIQIIYFVVLIVVGNLDKKNS